MSIISKLVAKPVKKIVGGIELNIYPLTMNESLYAEILSDENTSLEEKKKAMDTIMTITLKKAVPDITNEEIENLQLDYAIETWIAILEVNSSLQSNDPERIKRLKEKIKQLKEAAERR